MAATDFEILSNETTGDRRHICAATCKEVCSRLIEVDINGDIIESVKYTKGCDGNTKGVAALASGMSVDEVIKRLSGIDCHGKGTSCPDQLARVLKCATGR